MNPTESRAGYSRGVRAVAVFEAVKGLVVLLAGFGLFALMHDNLQRIGEDLVRHSHLNPARHYPRIFVEALAHLDDTRLRLIAMLAFLYASARLIEAYGLWRMRRWAQWLAIASGSIYVPIEVYELFRRATLLRAATLLANVFIVVYLLCVWFLWRQESNEAAGVNRGGSC